jgi:hypothetical protein
MRIPVCLICVLACLMTEAQTLFPDRCLGVWEGTMYIHAKGVLRDSVRVRRTIRRLDSASWTWRTDYLSEKMPATKDYVLRRRDSSSNEFVVDEGGGVEIPGYLTGQRLYSVFETAGFLLTAAEELTPEGLLFEVVSARRSGKPDAPVGTFQVGSVQRVLFVRRSD